MQNEVSVEPLLAFLAGYGSCLAVVAVIEIGRALRTLASRRGKMQ